MDRIVLNEPAYGDQIARTVGTRYNSLTCSSIVRVKNDVLLGGVMYDNFTGESIAAHIAGYEPAWLNRDLLWVIFDYPFNQLGVLRLFGVVAADNPHAVSFDTNLGFREVARIEGVYPGNVSAVVMRMDRDECRFFKVKTRNIRRNIH